jgi:hypothetical protein
LSTKLKIEGEEMEVDDETSTSFGAQIRYKLTENFELNADVISVDGDVTTGLGGVVHFSDSTALTVGVSTFKESTLTSTTAFIGLKVKF